MPEIGNNLLDDLLFGGLVLILGVVALVVFFVAMEVWRARSENRKLKRHFRDN
jgi:hypothetical protein